MASTSESKTGGPDLVIGFSPESDEQTAAAKDDGADYLGVGPVFGSTSKLDAGQAIGPGGIARRARLAGIPIIGIGGVDAARAPRVIAAGAVGVAVISAILGAQDPMRAARALRRAVDSALTAPATRPPVPRLMSITDSTNALRALPDFARRALAGGADAVQVREKHLDQARLLATVRAIVEAVSSPEFVVVNGDLGVALRVGTGLHLPESDEQIEVARDLLGSHVLIGRSVHSEHAARASAGADYLIAGHVFPTRSHNDRPPIGIEGLRRIVEAAPCPVLAIGGVDASNVGAAIAAGAHGAAVISAINDAADPDAAARLLRSKIDEALEA
jgi:thiamine-phosphate pyrophosphorylase